MYKARKIAFYDPQGKAELLGKMFFYYVRYVTHFFSQKRDTQQLAWRYIEVQSSSFAES